MQSWYKIMMAMIATFAFSFAAQAEQTQQEDVTVEFNYEDVQDELVQADELTELLIELGAIDEADVLTDEELMMDGELTMQRRRARRGVNYDNCRPGERCWVHPDSPRRDRDRHRDGRRDRRDDRHRDGRRHRDRHRDGRRDRDRDRYRPRPPRRDRVRPRPPHRRYPAHDYVCYAENYRGERFRAVGPRPRRVQERAMRRCYDYSYRCYELGCY